jgi:hypothetical protein
MSDSGPAARCRVLRWTDDEYQLTATAPIRRGEVAVAERPLVAASFARPRHGSVAWDLVDQILSDAAVRQAFYKHDLKVTSFPIEAADLPLERALATRHHVSALAVRELLHCVGTNNIGYFDAARKLQGLAIFPTLSRANHACTPNCRPMPGVVADKQVVFMALTDIAAGEAITWNYLDDSELMALDYGFRNVNLVNSYRFVCQCARCRAEVPPHLAEPRSALRYFDGLISRIGAKAGMGIRRS